MGLTRDKRERQSLMPHFLFAVAPALWRNFGIDTSPDQFRLSFVSIRGAIQMRITWLASTRNGRAGGSAAYKHLGGRRKHGKSSRSSSASFEEFNFPDLSAPAFQESGVRPFPTWRGVACVS